VANLPAQSCKPSTKPLDGKANFRRRVIAGLTPRGGARCSPVAPCRARLRNSRVDQRIRLGEAAQRVRILDDEAVRRVLDAVMAELREIAR
jgi:hypothetical protein